MNSYRQAVPGNSRTVTDPRPAFGFRAGVPLMDQAENPVGPADITAAADIDERREMPRCAVDVPVTLVVLSLGSMVMGRISEISLSGCRVLMPKTLSHSAYAAIECTFKIRGVGFRLGGIVEWAENNLAGVRFNTMSSRSRDNLMEVLCEVELENNAKSGIGVDAPAATARAAPAQPAPALPAPQSPVVAPVQPATQPPKGRDRRAAHRCGVDTSAVIDLVKVGSKLNGHILDLSVGGCRVRTAEKFPVGIYTRIETEFQLHGLPFRLGGVIQAIHDRNTVGIRFLDMSQRKKDQVAELVAEMEELASSQ
jgi:c-di-GMP-binding flagellar brake protein YcgR